MKRARAIKQINKLRKQGREIQPVAIEGKTIARSFWGKAWCEHLESFSDYENRLPRGRTYVRAGTVCHLEINEGVVDALVSGTSLYKVHVEIAPLSPENWQRVKRNCSGQIGSLLELLQGKLSDHVMASVTDRENGLFPLPGEMKFNCSCPDWATMCKHVAAVLYGVGARLDKQPSLLFTLRGVDHQELIASELNIVSTVSPLDKRRRIDDDALGDVFGIDISDEADDPEAPVIRTSTKGKPKAKKKTKPAPLKEQTARKGTASKKTSRSKPPEKQSEKRKTSRKAKSIQKKNPTSTTRKTLGKEKQGYRGPARMAPPKQKSPGASPVTGKKVADLRSKFHMTKIQFAKLIGVSTQSITNWEKNTGLLNLQDRTFDSWCKVKKLSRQSAWKTLDKQDRR